MKKIIISRTDSIGDVILTLPMAGVLKKHFPGCRIYFLGRNYTRSIIEACVHVDEFVEWPDVCHQPAVGSQQSVTSIQPLKDIGADVIIHAFPVKEICRDAKKAGIPMRIATSHRWYSWLYCNKLLHFSRKNSVLHEAQLNLRMLAPLGIRKEFSLKEIPGFYGLTKVPRESAVGSWQSAVCSSRSESNIENRISNIHHPEDKRFRLILHPKSKGSAREWGLDNFSRLVELLPEDRYRIYITGTGEEGALMKDFLLKHENRVTDLTGKFTLAELTSFINASDGLVSASTGPLHIAAALGKQAIGLYAPMKPIHPKRWAPVGTRAGYLVLNKRCNDCRHLTDCACIRSIMPEEIVAKLEKAN